MRKIAVYGTLRKGFGNHRIIKDAEMLWKGEVEIPFEMISLGGFPGLIPSQEVKTISMEVYSVNDDEYESVECLEGYPDFYQKAVISTPVGEAEAYVLLNRRYVTYPKVEDGDWLLYIKPNRLIEVY